MFEKVWKCWRLPAFERSVYVYIYIYISCVCAPRSTSLRECLLPLHKSHRVKAEPPGETRRLTGHAGFSGIAGVWPLEGQSGQKLKKNHAKTIKTKEHVAFTWFCLLFFLFFLSLFLDCSKKFLEIPRYFLEFLGRTGRMDGRSDLSKELSKEFVSKC